MYSFILKDDDEIETRSVFDSYMQIMRHSKFCFNFDSIFYRFGTIASCAGHGILYVYHSDFMILSLLHQIRSWQSSSLSESLEAKISDRSFINVT